jgi:hypothetical protein
MKYFVPLDDAAAVKAFTQKTSSRRWDWGDHDHGWPTPTLEMRPDLKLRELRNEFTERDVDVVMQNPLVLVGMDAVLKGKISTWQAMRLAYKGRTVPVGMTLTAFKNIFVEIAHRLKDGRAVVTPEMKERYCYVYGVKHERLIEDEIRFLSNDIGAFLREKWLAYYRAREEKAVAEWGGIGGPKYLSKIIEDFANVIWGELRQKYDPIARYKYNNEEPVTRDLLNIFAVSLRAAKTIPREDLATAEHIFRAKFVPPVEMPKDAGGKED